MTPAKNTPNDRAALARRRFLLNCGKFAVVTPPVVTLMLSASERSYAAVASGARGRKGNNGFGNGGGDGVPGNSGNNPSPNAPARRGDVIR